MLYLIKRKKGQSLIESSIVLLIVLMLLFFMVTVGFYIYDMVIYTYATNKALDRGVALLSRNNPENSDLISGNEIPEEEEDEMIDILLQSANARVFSPDYPQIAITTVESENEIRLNVNVEAEYKCNLPLVNEVFPQIVVSLNYRQKKL